MQDATSPPVAAAGDTRASGTTAALPVPGAVTPRQRLLLAAALVLLAFAFQGSRALYETDEGRYTDVALTMLDSHVWLVPHLDRERAIFTKPPLTYWSLAASFRAFGRNEWAARLPNALAFVATGFLVLGLARRFVPERPWIGAAAWLAMLAPTAAANVVTTDTLLTLWETSAMYAWVRADAAAARARPGWNALMWLAWGLAMLTKGPVALLPLLALLCALAAMRDLARLRAVFSAAGLACFVVVGLGWYVWLVATQAGMAGYFLGYELYDRMFTDIHGRHGYWYGAFTVYVPTLLVGAAPWSIVALVRFRGWQRAFATALPRGDRDRTLLLWWMLLPLAVFALSRSRLPLYLMPLYVPLALIVARTLLAAPPRRNPALLRVLAIAWLLALVALKAVAAYYPSSSPDNARAFAAQLSQTVPLQDFDEISFVDTRPVYGLRLYLERNIEEIVVHRDELPYASITSPEMLCDELRENERTLYLIRSNDRHRGHLDEAIRACGAYTASVIGRVRDFDAITVAPVPSNRP